MADSSTEKKRTEEYGARYVKGRWSEWSLDGNGINCETKEQTSGLSAEDLKWLLEPHIASYITEELAAATARASELERERDAANDCAQARIDETHRVLRLLNQRDADITAMAARASELETAAAEARDVLRHALSDFFEEEDGWIERASVLIGDTRLSRLKRAAKTEELLSAALAKRDAEISALGERVARAERENEAWRALAIESSGRAVSLDFTKHGERDWSVELVDYAGATLGKVAPRDYHHEQTPEGAALGLATKLGLLPEAVRRELGECPR